MYVDVYVDMYVDVCVCVHYTLKQKKAGHFAQPEHPDSYVYVT